VHVKAVGKDQRSALLGMRLNVVFVDPGDVFIGQQNHHHVSSFDGVVDFMHRQTSFFSLAPRCATFAQTNNDLDAAVVQVLRVGVALAAITNNGHRFAFDQAQVAVFVVINFHLFLLVKTNKSRL